LLTGKLGAQRVIFREKKKKERKKEEKKKKRKTPKLKMVNFIG
tara:strand:- start:289 stop:417 length:129 start_codon:yes stop_codon:yes gene_type:complete